MMSRRRRRTRSSFAKQLRWFALIVLVGSAVAFGREPGVDAAGRAPAPPEPRQVTRAERSDETPSDERYAQLDTPFFRSGLECESALRGRSRRSPRAAPRIGTWNLRWFPRGTKDGRDPARRSDVRWLACAIASLDVDVLAVQEVVQDPEGRAALLDMSERLDQLTGGRWRAELDACGGSGRQHVGLLYDSKRVELSDAGEVAALNPGRSACDRSLRPGFAAHARFADGSEAQLIAVHLDSGMQPRDFGNRRTSIERLREVLPALRERHAGSEPIVLGDFNTMGCAECRPALSAADELATLDRELTALQLKRVAGADPQLCSEYYRGHAGLLDHVVIAIGSSARVQHAALRAYGACAALACGAPPRGRTVAAFERLSDHCPLVLEVAPSPAMPAPARRRAIHR